MPDAPNPSTRRRIGALPFLAGILAFAVFLPALDNQFLNWDDDQNLLLNPDYRGLGWANLKWMFTAFHMGHYTPLAWISFGLDHALWGTNPAGYHLTNVLLHAINAVLFFGLSVRLMALAGGNPENAARLPWAGLFAALFFALHPLRVESVAWATERRDVLSAFFLLLAAREYVLYGTAASAGAKRRRYAVCLGLFVLSLLSKAIGMVFPAVLFILDIFPLRRFTGGPSTWFRRGNGPLWAEKIPFLVAAAAAMAVAVRAQTAAGAAVPLEDYSILHRAAQACYGAAYYLGKTLVPLGLSPVEIPAGFDPFQPVYPACAALLVLATILLFRLRRRWPAGLAAWTIYLALIAPTSGIFQSGPQFVADRYSYLSCMPWAIVAGGGVLLLARLHAQNRITSAVYRTALAAGLVALVGLSLLTRKQINVWRTSETLWTRTVALHPESSFARYNLAMALAERERWAEAEEHYLAALRVRPDFVRALYNLGLLYYRAGRPEDAAVYFRRAVDEKPDYAEARNNLGYALMKAGNWGEAVSELETALSLEPRSEKIRRNLEAARRGAVATP